MKEELYKWHSHHISREFQMLVFGDRGYPVVVFPTTLGRYYEAKDFLLIESVRWFVEQGLIQVYCPDTLNHESWYNKNIHPADRLRTHRAYENLIRYDVVERIRHNTGTGKIIAAGCSFGGYTAADFSFRFPHMVSHLMCMSSSFDIRSFLNGYYDELAYFHNPIDYVPGLQDPNLWQMRIILGVGYEDICKGATEEFAKVLRSKNIDHWLDYRPGVHDWPLWRDMFPHYLSTVRFG